MLVLSNLSLLYDGTTADARAIHRGVDILVRDGRIGEIRPHQGTAPAGAHVVDCANLVATPGLIDAHGHVTLHGVGAADLDRMNGPAGILEVEKILHATLVDGGVTTVRDVGGATHLLKRLIDDGSVIGPRLLVAITMLSTTGGHADFRGRDRCHDAVSKLFPAAPGRPSAICDGPWECRKRVRELAACGADMIKICAGPGVASPTDQLEHQDFSAEEIRATCSEAEARGLRVLAHAHGEHGIRLALENGVHDVQHASALTPELAALARRQGCVVTPTAWVIDELPEMDALPDFIREKARKVQATHGRAVTAALEAGVPILAGTDPVLPRMHGRNFMEMVHLVARGLPPLMAWHSMTGLAASVMGLADTGTLSAGARADLLLCRGDVVENPALLDQGALIEVFKDGVPWRGGMPGLVPRTFRDLTTGLLRPPRPRDRRRAPACGTRSTPRRRDTQRHPR
jgi:imidazolonepropionase-like amidohydrolase